MKTTRPAGYRARSLRCSSLMGRNWLTHFAPRASRSDASLGRTRRPEVIKGEISRSPTIHPGLRISGS